MDLAQATKISRCVRQHIKRDDCGLGDSPHALFRLAVKEEARMLKVSVFEVVLALYLASGNTDFRKPPFIV